MRQIVKLIKSFGYAFSGIFHTVLTERNMRIHVTCLCYMLGFLLLTDWFVLSRTDWAILVLASALVLAAELINTAVEKTVDLATSERHPLAKIAKDAAAGAVLIFAIGAVIVGILIMYQPEAFRQLWAYFTTHPLALAAFILSLVPATLFMFFGFGKKSRGE